MLSLTQKSRGCSLLLLSLAPSFLPPFPLSLLPTLAISLWPVLSLPVFRAPEAATSPTANAHVLASNRTAAAFSAPALLKSPTTTNTSNYISLTAVKTDSVPAAKTSASLFVKKSPTGLLITSSTAATKTASPHRGKPSSICANPVLCCLKCHPPLQRPKLALSNTLKSTHQKPAHRHTLLPFPHTCLTISTATHLDKNVSFPLSKTSQNASKTVRLHPPNCTNAPPVVHQTSSSLSHPPTTSPASSKSPASFPEASASPPDTPTSHQPRLPPPQSLPHTAAPLFEDQPFIVSWNIPDLVCNRYNISLDTSPFKGVATPAKVK